MGESGYGFGSEFMRKSVLKKNKKKRKLLNTMVPNFLYTKSVFYKVLLFLKNFSLAYFTRNKWAVRK